MAKAEYRDRRVEMVEKVIEEESFVVTLNREEAEMVRSLAGHVHLLKGDAGETLTELYDALSQYLGGWAKYTPTEIVSGSIVLKGR